MRVIAQLGIWPRTSTLARRPADQDSPCVTFDARLAMVAAQSGARRNGRSLFVVGSRFSLASQGARLEASNFRRYKEIFAVARTSSGTGETAPGADSISGVTNRTWAIALHAESSGVEERLYSNLATGVGLDPKILTDKLPKFSQAGKRDPDASSYERACAAYLGKDYAEAERLFLTIAAEAQQAIPTKTVDIIRALKLAARSAQKLDEYVRAREHLAEAEKLTDRQRNPREWADVQYAIAYLLTAEEEHPGDAEKLLCAVIDVRTQIFGPENRETMKARRVLALSLHLQSRHQEAEAEFREVVKLDEKMLGPENPETLRTRNDLLIFLWEHKHADALIESQQILKLREKVLGPEHERRSPAVITSPKVCMI